MIKREKDNQNTVKACKPIKRVAIIAAALAALALWTAWGNTALAVDEITVASAELPAAFSGFRIAHISDLHNAEFGEGNAELLRRIAYCEPDIIAITGDLIDASHTDIEIALDFARSAVEIAPVYFVSGNHEANMPEYAPLKDGLAAAGVTVLEDEALSLERRGELITLVGLSDPNFIYRENIPSGEIPAAIAAKLKPLLGDKKGFSLLLSHRPELFETYAGCGVDLTLSGHAHGGQFRLPFIGGIVAPNQGFFPKYDSGLYSEHGANMVVSRGLGNSIIPLRVNNRPEIIIVELERD